jgi:hypothetical protein
MSNWNLILNILTEFPSSWLGLRLRMLAICNQLRQKGKGKGKALPFVPAILKAEAPRMKILGRPMVSEAVEASVVDQSW